MALRPGLVNEVVVPEEWEEDEDLLQRQTEDGVFYPESDGKPMADNTLQAAARHRILTSDPI